MLASAAVLASLNARYLVFHQETAFM